MEKTSKNKLGKGILAGVIVSCITLFAGVIIFFIFVFFGGPAKVTKDISKYEEVLHQYSNIQTGFFVFPEKISENVVDTEFYFSYQDTWDDPTCEVFLQCTYTEEDFKQEVERLENTQKQHEEETKKLLKEDKGRFPYPAYIAIDDHNHAYEYALLTGENEITYVYTAFKNIGNIHFDKKYLPEDYATGEEEIWERSAWDGYCIYVEQMDEDGYTCSYERD